MTALTLLYASTICLGAFLLFQVQPIIGKMILPWFGGSTGVWTTCLLFFQSLLLLGYLYAHWSIRFLKPRAQRILHLALLSLSLLVLPIAPSAEWRPAGTEDPVLLILALLGASIGLPYFLLSTTGPLVQAWFAREHPGAVPYRLFALSNLGSMLGLLWYPIFIEPWLTVRYQSIGWSFAYAVFVLVCGTVAWHGVRAGRAAQELPDAAPSQAPEGRLLALWVALAACPSILLMAVTSHLTKNVAPIPFLWVLPLGLYLLSFILCFEGKAWYRRVWCVPLLVLGLGGMSYDLIADFTDYSVWAAIALYCGGFFVSCMVCHGELAKAKPHSRHLTVFYLMIAIGGAMGGAFVAVIAPRFFNGDYELPAGMAATALLVVAVLYRDPECQLHRFRGGSGWLPILGLTATLISTLAYGVAKLGSESRLMTRNFYGTLRVSEIGTGEYLERTLHHGTIVHGNQYLSAERRRWPTTYYGENTGVGMAILAMRNNAPQRVGIVGLGVGTLATYGRRNDHYRIYEINPLVIDLARTEFTFLSDSLATVEVVLGDARLSLEHEQSQRFDLLVVDAFSGDSIPMHLLTREAFGLYFRHLQPGGILAVHISSKYLDLARVIKAAADYYNKEARLVESDDEDEINGVYAATWVLVTDRPGFFEAKEFNGLAEKIELERTIRPWTDDYSSIYKLFRKRWGIKG